MVNHQCGIHNLTRGYPFRKLTQKKQGTAPQQASLIQLRQIND
jgi:hypothetical protein